MPTWTPRAVTLDTAPRDIPGKAALFAPARPLLKGPPEIPLYGKKGR